MRRSFREQENKKKKAKKKEKEKSRHLQTTVIQNNFECKVHNTTRRIIILNYIIYRTHL